MTRWEGIYPSTILPMDADFVADWDGYAAHTAACGLEAGIVGVLCNGHAGENTVLSAAEKRRAVEVTVGVARAGVGGRRLVVAGVNHEASHEAAREAADAAGAGADAIMVVPPNGFALAQDPAAIILHHGIIAAAIPGVPLFLFQGSHASRLAYPAAVLDRLLELPAVVAIKEGGWEVNGYDALRRQVRGRRPEVAVMASGDEHLLACMAHGSEGSLVSLADIVPGEIVALDAAVRRSDLVAARAIHERIEPLATAIYGHAPGARPSGGRATARIKWCLHALGRIPCAAVRPPAGPVDGREAEALGVALDVVRGARLAW